MSKKILITGGTGYLASNIGAFLELNAMHVTLGSRKLEKLNRSNLNSIETNWSDDELNFIEGFDVVINAAGPTALASSSDPVSAATAYEDNFMKLLQKLKIKKNKNIFLIQISTIHVYGAVPSLVNEKSPSINLHPYVRYRHAAEHQFLTEIERGTVKGVILRLGNCFGGDSSISGDGINLFINEICQEVKEKQTITIKTNPNQSRDFVPMTYICRVIEKIISNDTKNSVLNIVTGNTKKLIDVARDVSTMYENIYEKKAFIKTQCTELNSSVYTRYSNQKVSKLLKYDPDLYTSSINSLLRIE